MLSASVSVQKPSKMFYKEGILAGNTIMSRDEFASFIRPKIIEHAQSMGNSLLAIQNSINNNKIKEAYVQWELFEQQFLLNKDYQVSLLFIDNIKTSAGNTTFYYNSSEQDVMGNRGKLTRLSQIKQELFKAEIGDQIANHLQEFISDVESKYITMNDVHRIFEGNHSGMKRRTSEARWSNNLYNYSYRNIIYGDNPQYQGNIADAFMNHFAGMHAQILASAIDGLSIEDQQLFTVSVFNEERQNIFNLLVNSTNHTPWFSGGDIIMKIGDQVYNIQLKTGLQENFAAKRKQIGGRLAVQNLSNMITQITSSLTNPDTIIDIFYNELQTSGYIEITESMVENDLNNLIKF